MTAEEIRNHQFESLADGSYEKESVDAYVSDLAKAYDELFQENKEIVRRLTIFAKKIEEYKRSESYMTETLLTAQKTAAQTISGAESVVAKMIEAAKSEGRKIVNEAKERANELSADRDKILAEASEQAKKITEEADEQAKAYIEASKADIQKAIDEINGSADSVIADARAAAEKIIEEAKEKAVASSAGIAAEAEKSKKDADALRNEAFELKKNALLEKEELINAAGKDADAIRGEAVAVRRDADAYAHAVSVKAKAAAAGILLKAQADVNRLNDELREKTDALNAAIAASRANYTAVRALSEEVYENLSAQLSELSGKLKYIPFEEQLPEETPLAVSELAFAADSHALNDAVAAEDIDGVLRCFGIDTDSLLTAAAKEPLPEPVQEEPSEEEKEAPAAGESAEEPLPERTAQAEPDGQEEPEPVLDEQTEPEPAAEAVEESLPAQEAVSPESGKTDEPQAEEPDGMLSEEPATEPVQDTENAAETDVALEELFNDDWFEIPSDASQEDWSSWDDVGDAAEPVEERADAGREAEDDVKEFVPEIPSGSETRRYILPEDTDDMPAEPSAESLFDKDMPAQDDFEIDFSMFEVDEARQREKEERAAEKVSHKKKKKKKK